MEKVDAVPGNAPGTSASSNALEITVAPPSTPHPSPVPRPRREQSAKDSRCCFHFAKFETFIYIVGVFGIVSLVQNICKILLLKNPIQLCKMYFWIFQVMGIAKIVVIALHISKLYDHYEGNARQMKIFSFCLNTNNFAQPRDQIVRPTTCVELAYFCPPQLWLGKSPCYISFVP